MFNHNPEDDAHRKSNSKDAWVTGIQNVIVDLRGKVSPEMVNDILLCLKDGKPFILHNDISLFYYNPAILWGQYKNLNKEVIDYKFIKHSEMINNIKLTLITHQSLIIPAVTRTIDRPRIKHIKR